jgi:hypothetical protein
MEEIKRKIQELEAERAQLNMALPDDQFRATQIDQQLEELHAQLAAAEDQAEQDRVHAEVQEFVLGRDFSAALGHPDANKIVYAVLYEARMQHVKELRAKDDELRAEREAHAETAAELEAAKAEIDRKRDRLAEVIAERDEALAERDKMQEENRQLMNETRHLHNEVARLTRQVKDLEAKLETERLRASALVPETKTLDELLQEAANATRQRRLIKDLQPLDARRSRYAGTLEDGSRIELSWLELGQYQQVDEFPPAPPAGDQVAEDDRPVTADELDEARAEVVAAAEEAARFQDVVPGDAGGSAVAGGAEAAGDAVQPVSGAEAASATLEERVTALEVRLTEMEKWRGFIETRLFAPVVSVADQS